MLITQRSVVRVHAGPLDLLPAINYGAVAQLGERLICIQEVAGSIPVSSTKNFLFDNLEIGKIESPCPVIQCSQVIYKNNTLVKLLRVYGGCLGTWRR